MPTLDEKRTILEVKGLTYSYDGEKNALNDVSFAVFEGTHTAIIGHNGSGKSTMAKLVMGLLTGYKGEIWAFGEKLEKSNMRSLRSRIGIVFQNPDNQFVGSTVADDIAFGLENRQIPHDEMQKIIEEFSKETNMERYLEREPSNLSGGQKQRVAIAGVLAMSPDIVFFDEATAMLDPKGRREISELVMRMRKRNPKLTVISITHDIEEAAKSDHVIVLEGGNKILDGTPNEVFSHEEKLRECNLSLPFFVTLKNALKSKGFNVPDDITDINALEDYLCR
ncbi:MAG: energy-coupling factor transporter ATPase [Bacilli bacterium]|nr:energy-coupling factor transporter ATPase [Bacilli bacterium]